jgi:TonB family protein
MKRFPALFLLATLSTAAGARLARADSGDLSAADVKQVMAAHGDEVRRCYEKHAMRQSRATGKVTLDLIVGEQGDVQRVTVAAEGVRGHRFDRCVSGKAKGWQFPQPRHPTEVEYPFLFQHTRTATR